MTRAKTSVPCCGGTSNMSSAVTCGGTSSVSAFFQKNTAKTSTFETRFDAPWVIGKVATPVGKIPQVATKLRFADTLGSWKCRWSIGRMDYKVDPGLYAVGTPDENAPVLVTANYKMTFDRLREQLGGLNLWIVVLDTDGVNVWCAAGKGTFGTEELVYRISDIGLSRVVKHRQIILPQLGAVGIAAHEVKKRSGFRVIYGTVRAKDLKEFLANGMKATEEMRTVRFTFKDRIVLTPMELVGTGKPLLIVMGLLFLWNAVGLGHYGLTDLVALVGAILAGAVIAPALLPWVPGRAFAFKGALMGLIWTFAYLWIGFSSGDPNLGWSKAAGFLLLLPSLSAYLTMNFTGSSTYTSLSGVDKEMKTAIPLMLFTTAGGILLLVIGDLVRFFGGVIL